MKAFQIALNKYGATLDPDGVIGAKSIAAAQEVLKKEFQKRNWVWPTMGLIYVRLDENLTDTFDDAVCRVQQGHIDMIAPCSTTAGDYYLFTGMIAGGTAIACEQQVLFSHRFVSGSNWKSLWSGMPYFQQEKPIFIYRDANKDRVLNRNLKQFGNFGINLHRGWSGLRNWNASAGCQVTPDAYWTAMIQPFKLGQVIDFNLIELL
jgi:hypothetical protein